MKHVRVELRTVAVVCSGIALLILGLWSEWWVGLGVACGLFSGTLIGNAQGAADG